MPLRSFSIASLSPKPLITTFAPSWAKVRARERPMPLVEPVTRATLPLSMKASFSLSAWHGTVSFPARVKAAATKKFRKIKTNPARIRTMDTRTFQSAPLGIIRRPERCDRIALVLQGGGALGAYQAGVYQALNEVGLEPDWISGVS